MIFLILMIFLIFLGMVLLHGILCNFRTFNDRTKIIVGIFNEGNWLTLSQDFELVSYDRHWFHRLLFLNPRKLYSDKIRIAMRW